MLLLLSWLITAVSFLLPPSFGALIHRLTRTTKWVSTCLFGFFFVCCFLSCCCYMRNNWSAIKKSTSIFGLQTASKKGIRNNKKKRIGNIIILFENSNFSRAPFRLISVLLKPVDRKKQGRRRGPNDSPSSGPGPTAPTINSVMLHCIWAPRFDWQSRIGFSWKIRLIETGRKPNRCLTGTQVERWCGGVPKYKSKNLVTKNFQLHIFRLFLHYIIIF